MADEEAVTPEHPVQVTNFRAEVPSLDHCVLSSYYVLGVVLGTGRQKEPNQRGPCPPRTLRGGLAPPPETTQGCVGCGGALPGGPPWGPLGLHIACELRPAFTSINSRKKSKEE